MNSNDILAYFVMTVVLGACIYVYLDNQNKFQLKCIVSDVDGNKYCVRERKNIKKAADLLAKATAKCEKLVEYVAKKHPDNENVKRLVKNFNPRKMMETLPTSTYTAYSENKGEKIAFCLNKKKGNDDDLIDEHTLTFVTIHELSHVSVSSIGHKPEFWHFFKFLLENAKEAGIHDPRDYKKEPRILLS